MYAFITGKIEDKTENSVIIECNGIGYEIFVSTNTLSLLGNVGEVAKVYTYLHVREDAFLLFGFLSYLTGLFEFFEALILNLVKEKLK